MEREPRPQTESKILDQLTSYLDGELSPSEVIEVEERIASDQEYRSTMQELQKTWDVLDVLPAAASSREFTQSTMKMVIQDASPKRNRPTDHFSKWLFKSLVLFLLPTITSVSAIFASYYVQSAPIRKLEANLSVIDDFDLLNCDSNLTIEFLTMLADSPPIFGITVPSDNDRRSIALEAQPGSIAELSQLDDVEKNRIRANRDRFHMLELGKKQRLRSLRQQISDHPNSNQLRRALYRYQFWLSDQTSLTAAEIKDSVDPTKKIELIRSTVEDQFLPNFASQLQPEDRNSVFLALVYLIEQRRALIDQIYEQLFGDLENLMIELDSLRELSRDGIADDEVRKSPDFRAMVSGRKLKQIYEKNPEAVDEIVSEKLARIIKTTLLSDPARDVLEMANNLAAGFRSGSDVSQEQLLTRWMLLAFDEYFREQPPNLQEFFNSLTTEEREKLNDEFPEDRELILLEKWKKKFDRG